MQVAILVAFAKQVGTEWAVISSQEKAKQYKTLPEFCPVTDLRVIVNSDCFNFLEGLHTDATQVAQQMLEEYTALIQKYTDLIKTAQDSKAGAAIALGMEIANIGVLKDSGTTYKSWKAVTSPLFHAAIAFETTKIFGGPEKLIEATK